MKKLTLFQRLFTPDRFNVTCWIVMAAGTLLWVCFK